MVFVLQCVSTCSLTRRWTSPCLHARIRALCSAKYRAETFPTDQGTKKGYYLFTLKGTLSCFSYKPGTLLRKFEKPISLWATDPDLKHTWFIGQREYRQYIMIFYLDEVIDEPGGWSDVLPDIFVYLIRFSEFFGNTAISWLSLKVKDVKASSKSVGPQLLARCSVLPLIIEQTSAPTFALTWAKVANN